MWTYRSAQQTSGPLHASRRRSLCFMLISECLKVSISCTEMLRSDRAESSGRPPVGLITRLEPVVIQHGAGQKATVRIWTIREQKSASLHWLTNVSTSRSSQSSLLQYFNRGINLVSCKRFSGHSGSLRGFISDLWVGFQGCWRSSRCPWEGSGTVGDSRGPRERRAAVGHHAEHVIHGSVQATSCPHLKTLIPFYSWWSGQHLSR